MKIYSWNIFFRNGKLERAFEFIQKLDFDVLCLQEVPEEFLVRLQKLPVHVSFGPDVDRVYPDRVERNFLVILSRHRILSHGTFSLGLPEQPLRTRLFVKAMRPLHWSRIKNRHGFFADIRVSNFSTPVRIFCLHLTLAHPEVRHREFAIAMEVYDPRLPTVICGDFNILDTPYVAPFNWVLGGSVGDALRWKRERRAFEREFSYHGFVNSLRGKRTHLLSEQLDHILTSRELSVTSSHVVPERIGSDHYPIHVEINMRDASQRKEGRLAGVR